MPDEPWDVKVFRRHREDDPNEIYPAHRDLDQKNVLWRADDTPAIIEWEAAGLINPAMELASVALYWSGQAVGYPSQATFDAVVKGYRSTGASAQARGTDALWGYAGTWLGWLAFNMRRSLGDGQYSVDERKLGERETVKTIAILQSLTANLGTWAEWLGDD